MEQIISRHEASRDGLMHYFTGKPCRRGHVDLRYVSTGRCLECNREDQRRHYAEHPEYVEQRRQYSREWMRNKYHASEGYRFRMKRQRREAYQRKKKAAQQQG